MKAKSDHLGDSAALPIGIVPLSALEGSEADDSRCGDSLDDRVDCAIGGCDLSCQVNASAGSSRVPSRLGKAWHQPLEENCRKLKD